MFWSNEFAGFKALVSVRVPLETLRANGKLNFNSNNNDWKNNYSKISGNNINIIIITDTDVLQNWLDNNNDKSYD